MNLYHGSIIGNITELSANSGLHGKTNQKTAYLTDCRPYALLYIWDSNRNIKQGKHVTGWIKDGIVYYEEQFPNQLKTFYDGVGGYLYVVNDTALCAPVNDRESMWFSLNNIKIDDAEYIPNVYDELYKCINTGVLKVIRFEEITNERINSLYECIEKSILSKRLLETPNDNDALFYQKFFYKAWEIAKNKNG